MDVTNLTWVCKRDTRVSRSGDEILFKRDRINYLRPELQLQHKASGFEPKVQSDFDACPPLLDVSDWGWLRSAIEVTAAGHPWLNER